MQDEVRWYLVEQLSLARGLVGVDDIGQRREGILAHFGGSLEAFRHLGVMSHDEINDWNDRMLVALGIKPPERVPGVAQFVWVGDGEPPEPDLPLTPSPFVRQVPGPDREIDVRGGRLRVIAVEMYRDSAVLRWRVAPEPDLKLVFPEEIAALERDVAELEEWAADHLRATGQQHLRMMRLYAFELEDDVGTRYLRRGGGQSGGFGEMTGETRFMPAPPTHATHLVVRWLESPVHIPIT